MYMYIFKIHIYINLYTLFLLNIYIYILYALLIIFAMINKHIMFILKFHGLTVGTVKRRVADAVEMNCMYSSFSLLKLLLDDLQGGPL